MSSRRLFTRFGAPLVLATLVVALGMPVAPLATAVAPTPTPARNEAGVEVPELRTRTSRTFQQAEGYRTEFAAGSIHYQDPAGTWQPVDTTLVAAGASGFAWSTKANDTKVDLTR